MLGWTVNTHYAKSSKVTLAAGVVQNLIFVK